MISERDFYNLGHFVGWQVVLFSGEVYSNSKKFGECAFECRDRSGNKRIMDCYSRTVSCKSEATLISLREPMMAI